MRNITITLDDETARWVRLEAAGRKKSVSSFLRELLRERMLSQQRYEESMRRFLSRPPRPLKRKGSRYPSREELHDLAGTDSP